MLVFTNLNRAKNPPIKTQSSEVETTKSARYEDTPIARLMLSAPTKTEAINSADITTPIGDNPASIATIIPA